MNTNNRANDGSVSYSNNTFDNNNNNLLYNPKQEPRTFSLNKYTSNNSHETSLENYKKARIDNQRQYKNELDIQVRLIVLILLFNITL